MTHPLGRRRSIGLHLLVLSVTALALLGRGAPLHAQTQGVPPGSTLFAGTVESSAFPTLSMNLFAVDPTGLPILSLSPATFTASENGATLPSDRLTLRQDAAASLDLVIALDRSTDDTSWAGAQSAVFGMLEQLRPGDEVALVSYADSVDVLAAPTGDLNQVRAALAGAVPGGSLNALNQAVAQGLELLGPDEGHRRALVIIANGANDLAEESGAEVPTTDLLVQRARAQGAALHLMGYGLAAAAPDLALLARGTGGRTIPATAAADLIGHAQALPPLLRQGYVLSYQSTLPADGAQGRLGVALAGSTPVERPFVAQPGVVVVQITQPRNGQTVSGQVVLGLSAQAPAPLAGVTFALEDGEIITTTSGAVSGIIWDSAAVTPGQRSISVTAQDMAGNVGVDTVDLIVRAPLLLEVQPPAESVEVGATALVTAYVESAFGSPVVELFVGRTQVGMKTGIANPQVFEVETATFAPGSYGITVRAANSGGFAVSDNSHVLMLIPPPVTVSTGATAVVERSVRWVQRNWPWLALAVAALGALALAYWLAQRLRTRAQVRQTERAAARARLVPQVRMLLTNAGNTRTRYRLLGQDTTGELRFTFLLNGTPLLPPAVAQVKRPAAAPAPLASNGVPAQTAPAFPTAAVATAQGAGQAVGLAGQFMAGLGQVLPGAAGDQMRQMAGGIRSQQSAAARMEFQVSNTVDDLREVSAMGTQIKGGAPVPPARPVAPPHADFTLQPSKGAAIASAPALWVLTPPIPPGDTLSIDIHIAAARRAGRTKDVQFTVLSAPLDQESLPPMRDDVRVRLDSSR